MTTEETTKTDTPCYQEKILEFNYSDIDTKLKDLLYSQPNLNCLI